MIAGIATSKRTTLDRRKQNMRHISCLAALGTASLLAACAPMPVADAPPVVVDKLATATTTASGQPIVLPQDDVHVVLSDYRIAPGAKLPVHKHPFPRLALVQAGTLDVTNVETGETITYRPGDMIVEAMDQWHFGVNAGSDQVHLLVIDETAGDVSNTVLQK
jgi:quercetin dioxygenase-like cupin family protein